MKRVFVVGYGYSGTSLLLQILGKHPSLFESHGETKFFDSFPLLYMRFGDLRDDELLRELIELVADVIVGHQVIVNVAGKQFSNEPSMQAVATRKRIWNSATVNRDLGTIFRLVFDDLTVDSGHDGWVEKTPAHVYHIENIIRLIPDARIIVIVRDPRDVLASKRKRRQDVWHSNRYADEKRVRKHLEMAYDPVWDALAWKAAYNSPVFTQPLRSQCHIVRYEDLVKSPATEVRSICSFLDLSYHVAMIADTYRISADLDKTGHQAGITTDSIGRWRSSLPPADVMVAQLLLKPEMRLFRYERQKQPRLVLVFLPLIILRSLADFFYVYRERLGLRGDSTCLMSSGITGNAYFDCRAQPRSYNVRFKRAQLLTSRHEGSPTVVKEALACNLPIVSADVGDVRQRIKHIDGNIIVTPDTPVHFATAIAQTLERNQRTDGRRAVTELDEALIIAKLIAFYGSLCRHD